MLVRETRRLIFIVLPLFIILFISWRFYNDEPIEVPAGVGDWMDRKFDKNPEPNLVDQEQKESTDSASHDKGSNQVAPSPNVNVISSKPTADHEQPNLPIIPGQPITPSTSSDPVIPAAPVAATKIEDTHDIIYAISTSDKKYFTIKMGNQEVMNPNIIPHPSIPDTWIVVAQQDGSFSTNMRYFTELYCNAQFLSNGTLACIHDPTILPIEPTTSDKCEGNLAFAAFNVGPHDARVFYGPKIPYTIYGSQSSYSCFGLWAQDLRELVQWGNDPVESKLFSNGTEIQRPPPWGRIEKNFFLFWDTDETLYAHHDMTPKRVFAKVEADGSVGPDLAPAVALNDDKCLTKYLPKLAPESESIHQATNSLSITLCNRSDSTCSPTDENTVLFTVYQHKKFHYLHALYEPYVMAYNRTAPFEIYGMSKKPIWINGRVMPEAKSEMEDPHHVAGQEMLYVVSMNWKKAGQNYHGFQDDELLLSFGIEDHHAGAIDILAGDLFKGLGRCE